MSIRVGVADDQAMIRQALCTMLGLEDDVEIVGQADCATRAVRLAAEMRPDVLIMDVQLDGIETPNADGISATRQVREVSPDTRVLIVTTFARPGYLTRALAAGAAGFIVKDAPADELVEAVRTVAAGGQVIDARLAVATSALGPCPLTQREVTVLAGASGGGTTAEIARRIHLAEGTVRNTLSTAMGKLSASTRADAVRIATERGWL